MWGQDDGKEIPCAANRGGTTGIEIVGVQGRAAAYKQTHARILLLSDENQAGGAMKGQDIARALTVGSATVERVRRRCGRVRRSPWSAGSKSIAAGKR